MSVDLDRQSLNEPVMRWLTIVPRVALWGKLTCLALAILAFGASAAHASSTGSVSPDGRYTATILQTGVDHGDGSGSQALVIADKRTGQVQRRLVSQYSDDPHQNLTNLGGPMFSLDGGYVYFSGSDGTVTSSTVQQLNLKTGAVRFVVSGWALAVIRSGPYRGYLLVQQHRYYDRPTGGSYNPVFVIRPDGHEEFIVPGSDNDYGELVVQPWLAKQGWKADRIDTSDVGDSTSLVAGNTPAQTNAAPFKAVTPPATSTPAPDPLSPLKVILIGAAVLYFLPSMIGFIRRKRNAIAILALNLFLGWTFLGWVAALIWSLLSDAPVNREALG